MYLRLSSFYLWYFAALGALLPYWGLYLKSLGYSAVEIGELIAIMMATKIIAPNIWGWIADRSGRRMPIVRVASLLAALAFAGVFLGNGYWWLALVVATFSFFWNAALPQFEAVTMSHLGERTDRYSRIRLWGSIGFIAAVVALGTAIDRHGVALLPAVLLGLFLAIWCSTLAVADRPPPAEHQAGRPPLAQVLRRGEVVALLTVCFLMQASHGPYYSFFTIHLEAHGYPGWLIGQLWALGVLAEIGVFLLMSRMLPRFGVRKLLLASLALATLRWLLIAAFVESLAVMLFAQILHAASFGIYHAVAIGLIHRYFTGTHQGRGQALYSSLSFGAGGALGSLYAGYLWDSAGATPTFLIAASVSAVAFVVALRGIPASRP
jgi:MFS transporter, PPP family, 3-phenylpropionic acid transporter